MSDEPPLIDVATVVSDRRYAALREAFKSKYGHDPQFFARASGRVNLIGEHIDYCGYAVLPMAIEQDIVIAASATANDQKLLLANQDPNFCDFECNLDNITIDKSAVSWYTYVLCGIRGIQEAGKLRTLKGVSCMVDGNVPKGAGLSSSSALVCCSALVTVHANNQHFTKTQLAGICAKCECYCGTEGGGMDQSISFMAELGTAKLIEFQPITATDVKLPSGITFVISNSCVQMHKAATSHFNIRVVECRLASQVIAKAVGLAWQEFEKLSNLQKCLGFTLENMLSVVRETLHPHPYTKKEICEVLEVTERELAQTSLSQNTLTVDSFKLYDRATHVFSEANRVLCFKAVCDEPPEDAAQILGNLMNTSHISCRDLYECSCPELDRLVDLCCQSGALGSRLTGAGWGGCAVSMVPTNQVGDFLQKMKSSYYDGNPNCTKPISQYLFATRPGGGAVTYINTDAKIC